MKRVSKTHAMQFGLEFRAIRSQNFVVYDH